MVEAPDISAGHTESTAPARVLLVEDNALTAETLSAFLERDGMRVTVAGDGPQGWLRFQSGTFDLILLDVMLPGFDRLELLRRIRQRSAVPVLMVTARIEEEAAIDGLAEGADDYIRKPYSPREVVARCRRALAREAPVPDQCIQRGSLVLNPGSREVTRAGQTHSLTPAEFAILECLMKRSGRVISRGQLLEVAAPDRSDVTDRTVDNHLYNLRQKLETNPREPRLIVTEYGVGYRLVADP